MEQIRIVISAKSGIERVASLLASAQNLRALSATSLTFTVRASENLDALVAKLKSASELEVYSFREDMPGIWKHLDSSDWAFFGERKKNGQYKFWSVNQVVRSFF